MPPTAHHAILVDLLQSLPRDEGTVWAVEVGVGSGALSEALLRGVPDLFLWMVDSWTCPTSGTRKTQATYDTARRQAERRTEFAEERRRILHQTSVSAADSLVDGGFGLVFIDADHRYEAVKADIAAWWSKVSPGGILSGHDYRSPRNGAGGWGVQRAVDEFVAAQGLALEHRETVWIVSK